MSAQGEYRVDRMVSFPGSVGDQLLGRYRSLSFQASKTMRNSVMYKLCYHGFSAARTHPVRAEEGLL